MELRSKGTMSANVLGWTHARTVPERARKPFGVEYANGM